MKSKSKFLKILPPPPPFPVLNMDEPSAIKQESLMKRAEKINPKQDYHPEIWLKDSEFEPDDIISDIQFPDKLDEIEPQPVEASNGLLPLPKPKEIAEAEDEIRNAVENAKKQKFSIFKRLFSRHHEPKEEHHLVEMAEVDGMQLIQSKINETRKAIESLDMKSAKKMYVEILGMYNKLEKEEKTKIYDEISDLYNERKTAEQVSR